MTTISLTSPTLGAVDLDDHLEWINKAISTGAAGSEGDTLGGRVIIQRLNGVTSGRFITLAAVDDGNRIKGVFSYDVRDDLMTIRDSGETCTLNYHGDSYSVMIPIDGINISLYEGCVDDETDNWYVGTVTFKTV